jgi:hypothetical protein
MERDADPTGDHHAPEPSGFPMPFRAASFVSIFLSAIALGVGASSSLADKIPNGIAVFAALDKVTGKVSPLEIPINETANFGSLKVTPRVCFTRPPTEPPLTSVFVEVDKTVVDGSQQRIFTGWMFAQSPGLHAVEDPTFDVWLTNCKTPVEGRSSGRRSNSPRP